jgi:hypothetical protein
VLLRDAFGELGIVEQRNPYNCHRRNDSQYESGSFEEDWSFLDAFAKAGSTDKLLVQLIESLYDKELSAKREQLKAAGGETAQLLLRKPVMVKSQDLMQFFNPEAGHKLYDSVRLSDVTTRLNALINVLKPVSNSAGWVNELEQLCERLEPFVRLEQNEKHKPDAAALTKALEGIRALKRA